MKIQLFAILLLWTASLSAQNLDSLGIDNKPFLNSNEAKLLNSLLVEQRGVFDFNDKKVAFVTGSSGSKCVTKSDYFQSSIKPWLEKGTKPQVAMVTLTEQEKERSGGYDVFVLSWVKLFTSKTKEKIISLLGEQK